jgi:hypothetical protein
MNPIIMQLSLTCYHFLPFRFIYPSHHPILKHILFSSLTVRDKVPHPYKAIRKIIVLYILILTFIALENTKTFGLNGRKHYPNSILFGYPNSNM